MGDLKKAVNAPERLIDANELMEWLRLKIGECVFMNAHAEAATTEEIIRYVKHMPAVDAVPVVRCRDCKHYDEGPSGDVMICYHRGMRWPDPNDYCSNGERRDT